jgi:hypothetical protein
MQGYLAATAGTAIPANPYDQESVQFTVWMWGYTDYILDAMGPCEPRKE